jgi:proton-dependent oligopeptide transporter, POT family
MQHVQKDQGKVLFIASFTEFGERYSYYVIQALLIFFLVDRFHIAQATSASMVGTALSMIYISAIVGGFISDKLIGYYPAAFLGSILMIIGSYILSISSSENILCIGLTFISMSTGLIKSNISSFIGKFYNKSGLSNSHRDFGFNIFYVGINLGSFFALLFASYLKDKYGFAAPFYSSMAITIIMFLNLSAGFFILRNYIDDNKVSIKNMLLTFLIVIFYSGLIFIILKKPAIAQISIYIASILCLIILFKSAQIGNRSNTLTALIFFCLSIIYWALFFQFFISILLFVDKTVEHNFLGLSVGSSQFLAVESIGVILFGGLMGKLWLYFGKKGKAISDIDKFNFGFIILTLYFIILYIATQIGNNDSKVSAFFMVIGFMLLSLSELSLSAIGLSLMTKIAPTGFVSLYMGIWLVTLGIGGKIAGFLSRSIIITDNIATSKISMASGLREFILLSVVGIIICLIARKKIIKQINY